MGKNDKEKIVEKEPVIINEADVIPEEEISNDDEIMEVEAPEIIVEPEKVDGVKLEILVAFTDKYTEAKYKIGDVIEFSKERANELLTDKRGLVKEVI